MAKSMLAAIHDAQHVGPESNSPEGETTGAEASETGKDTTMSKETSTSGAPQNAGIPQAEHDEAVAAAESSGREAGATAERERISAALGADGIKGDGKRMAAALELAVKSPAMSSEDVAAFVTGNMPAASEAGGDGPSAYEQNRVLGSGLAAPEKREPAKSGLSKNIDAHIAHVTRA